ncbi:MAG: Lipoprotein signal peptidase [Candidatus Uhrbacteria bacterium GW2011_GWF2_41_16]|uniref:Lipoprotein signal peptidase n=2 Tax=Candidatus Uhriibacteriota TaxID=1752732 RepID=A0A0G0XLZ8_9BACT|nr:MAG: Lipoprotein signal peptidase [Candidatus Uhrbacteria bacterium GW2011_GWC2_41_11]KKR97815.1 MAG: Lipoprotein signal peptidase [Candidatus Uhrbacteria bacterium GW2011_GWF2_41_16]
MNITESKKAIIKILGTGLIVLFDVWMKRMAVQSFPREEQLIQPSFFDLAVHKNYGIAFDIPFRIPIVIVLTIIVLGILVRFAIRHWQIQPQVSAAAWIIILGSLGNLFDRIYYGFTVDYLIFFSRSAVNLSDAIIVTGVLLLLLTGKSKKKFFRQ